MTQTISEILLSQLSQFIAAQMGLHFPKERWHELERGIKSAAEEWDFKDPESCVQWLLSSRLENSQIEILASHLTVGETYFLRDKKSFQILREHVLPELISTRRENGRRLRIWSAGCCTGEEPYSMAMLLTETIPDWKDWNLAILATDINPRFLHKASKGLYTEWSFRETPPWIKAKYFKMKNKGSYEILPQLKKMITFACLNLAEDSYPSLLNNTNAIDLILCRNVLMYFAPERVKHVIQNLYRSLLYGGYLIVSPSEISDVLFTQFRTVNFPGAVLYKKEYKLPPAREASPVASYGDPKSAFQLPLSLGQGPQVPLAPGSLPGASTGMVEHRGTDQEAALYQEALRLYEQGCYSEAVNRIRTLLSEDLGTALSMTLLARAYANQGNLTEAREWSEKATETDKLNPGYHYLLATILQELGQLKEATLALKRALFLDPNFVLAHFALGNLTGQQGKGKESEKHFQNALALLKAYRQEDVLPESDGMTAGRLVEIIHSAAHKERTI